MRQQAKPSNLTAQPPWQCGQHRSTSRGSRSDGLGSVRPRSSAPLALAQDVFVRTECPRAQGLNQGHTLIISERHPKSRVVRRDNPPREASRPILSPAVNVGALLAAELSAGRSRRSRRPLGERVSSGVCGPRSGRSARGSRSGG
jgi:hypothetical protein